MKKLSLLKAITIASTVWLSAQAQAFTVGIAMPTQNEDRWYKDGFKLQDMLSEKGFKAELFYAGDIDPKLQERQIRRLSDSNVDLLVVGATDCTALSDSLAYAKSKNIPVISYDRLILNTDAISYYASFDNFEVGLIQGNYLRRKLNLDSGADRTIEIFYGSLDDNNAAFFYEGAMSVLRPYILLGNLKVLSGRIDPEQNDVQSWRTDLASKRMEEILEKVDYKPNGQGGKKLDGILSPADCISDGIIHTLKRHGFTSDTMPIITGQDATSNAIKNIKEGLQAMTIYKAPDQLCKTVVDMAVAISKGEEVDINDTTSYNNGVTDMLSYLCIPKLVDKQNVDTYDL